MVVVLPAPLGPRNPCTSPVRTSRSSPSRARVGPKVLTSPEIKIAVDIGVVTASFPGPPLAARSVHTLRFLTAVDGRRGVERERRPVVDAGAALDQAAGRELAGQDASRGAPSPPVSGGCGAR